MSYYKVFYTLADNTPSYWIGNARSKEHVIHKADVLPDLVYDVWLLSEWEDECDSRWGVHSYKIDNAI